MNKLRIIIFIYAFTSLVMFSSNAVGISKNYTEILENAGINSSPVIVTQKDVKETSVSIELPNSNSIFLKASQISNLDLQELSKYKVAIIACDTPFILEEVSCSYDTLAAPIDQQLVFYRVPDRDYSIGRVDIDDTTFYLVPEQYLLVPKFNDNLATVLSSVRIAQDSQDKFSKNVANKSLPHKQMESKSGLLIELAHYALLSLLLFSFLYTLFYFVRKHKNNLVRPEFYADVLRRLLELYRGNKTYITVITLVAVMTTLIFLLTISITDSGVFDLNYISRYITESFSYEYLNSVEKIEIRQVRFALLFLLLVDLSLLLLLFVPEFVVSVAKSTYSIIDKPVNVRFYKTTFPILVIALLVLLMLDGDLSETLGLFVLLFLFLSLVMFKATYNRVNLGDLYTTKQKYGILVFTVLLCMCALFSTFSKPQVKYEYEDLLGLKNDILFLPYLKTVGANVLFKELVFEPENSIYINEIKVFDQKYKRIENLPLKNFSSKGSWEVVFTNDKNFPSNIMAHPEVLNALSTNSVSRYIFINKSSINDDFVLELTFDCSNSASFREIKIQTYYVTGTKTDDSIFYFPGCKGSNIGQKSSYRVPLFLSDASVQVIKVDDFEKSHIRTMQLLKNNEQVQNEFLNDPLHKPVVARKYGISKDLFVYSPNTPKEVVYTRQNNELNLGKIASDLLLNKHIKNPFLIWSSDKNVILRNEVEIDYSSN